MQKTALRNFAKTVIRCYITRMTVFRRKIYDSLVEWKNSSKGRCALMVEGPRGCGKTTIVKEFAAKEYRSCIFIDFSDCPPGIKELFSYISDLDYFFFRLQFLTGTKLIARESLIVFDEVQLFPPARQAVKALVKDGRYDYLETGCLISIRKNAKDILIPSEEKRIKMCPMDLEEFLAAIGKDNAYDALKTFYSSGKPLGQAAVREAMRLFRLYMVIGGMPQAVSTYLEHNNLEDVDDVKRSIIDLYEDDFYKIDPTGTLSILFDAIPGELSTASTRFNVSHANPSLRPSERTVLTNIAELAASRAVLVSYHTNDPNPGFSMTKDLRKFKLYLADTGLFITLAFRDKAFTENLLYRGLMSDKLPVNLGYVYENITARMLEAKGDGLFYHTFYNQESNHIYEIDFLISRGSKLCPLEVKSSSYTTHTSLDRFREKYHSGIRTGYLVAPKDYRKDGESVCIPPFFVPFI